MSFPQLTSAAAGADLRGFVVFLLTGRLSHERVSLFARCASEDRPPVLDHDGRSYEQRR